MNWKENLSVVWSKKCRELDSVLLLSLCVVVLFFLLFICLGFFCFSSFFQIPTVKNIQSLINDVVIYLRVSIRDGNNKPDLTLTCKVKGKDSLLFAIISREKLKRFYSIIPVSSLFQFDHNFTIAIISKQELSYKNKNCVLDGGRFRLVKYKDTIVLCVMCFMCLSNLFNVLLIHVLCCVPIVNFWSITTSVHFCLFFMESWMGIEWNLMMKFEESSVSDQ